MKVDSDSSRVREEPLITLLREPVGLRALEVAWLWIEEGDEIARLLFEGSSVM